jgi:hypothetical protein
MSAHFLTTSHDPTQPANDENPAVLSYFALRRFAGYIGFALPVIVFFYGKCIHSCVPASISGSYYTGVRNVFVGSLCSIGVFLVASIGYKRDRIPSVIAGAAAFVVAFSPCTPDGCAYKGITEPPYPFTPCIHTAAATTLFLTFAWFCLVLFTRTADDPNGYMPRLQGLPHRKKIRNATYIICGSGMLLAMLIYALHTPLGSVWPALFTATHLLLGVEWTCLWLFGFAWLTKGQQLFADEQPHPHP